jgi:hypothetical protein
VERKPGKTICLAIRRNPPHRHDLYRPASDARHPKGDAMAKQSAAAVSGHSIEPLFEGVVADALMVVFSMLSASKKIQERFCFAGCRPMEKRP